MGATITRSTGSRFRALRTIRGQIFLGFCTIGVLTGALGGYGIYATTVSNRIVADTYDRPLMAINFARAASVAFAQMENQVLQLQLTQDATPAIAKLKSLTTTFFEDLAVAEQRSMSQPALAIAVTLRRLAETWVAAVAASTQNDHIPESVGHGLAALSDDIMEKFDRLIELTAEDGFRERQRSLSELGRTTVISITYSLLALILGVIITFVLSRRILRPLSAAVGAADRIAAGDFAAAIPAARHDELGSLLRSMQSMQTSIRATMDREADERRSAQRRLVDAIEGSREAMMLVDAEGRIVIMNRQVRRLLPQSAGDIAPGASFDELAACALSARPASGNGRGQPAAAILANEGEVQLRPGLWLRVSRSSTQDGGFFLFWSDISDIKEREERLVEAMREAEGASRAKSNFLATMSHELRTPLNAIIGFSEIISTEMFGPIGNPRYHEYGTVILRSGRHLLGVITNVLDYAKTEAGQAQLRSETVDLIEVVHDCAQIVRDQCDRGELTLDCAMPAGPLLIQGDAAKLRQMLLNLLSNAIKFTNVGGSVTIDLAAAPAGGAVLSVSDTGIGMDAADIPVALSPFRQIGSRLARRYEGTGLGLPLAKAFAELHGATFAIASAPGEGTTITVRLPGDAGASGIAHPAPALVHRIDAAA